MTAARARPDDNVRGSRSAFRVALHAALHGAFPGHGGASPGRLPVAAATRAGLPDRERPGEPVAKL